LSAEARVAAKRCVLIGGAVLGLLAGSAGAAAADPDSPWALRAGGQSSSLEGAVGNVYPREALSGRYGLSFRGRGEPWRLRTGLEAAILAGTGDVPATFDPALVSEETWQTLWLEVPVVAERSLGHGRAHPYVAAGLAAGFRLGLKAGKYPDYAVPAGSARTFAPSASASAGYQWRSEYTITRLELGFAHGLGDLYASGDGPTGSWRALSLVLDVGI
jgi:hypothetical protein